MGFILRIINLWLPVRKGENMGFFEIIYGLMYGEYVLEGYRVPISHIFRHEFRPGSKSKPHLAVAGLSAVTHRPAPGHG